MAFPDHQLVYDYLALLLTPVSSITPCDCVCTHFCRVAREQSERKVTRATEDYRYICIILFFVVGEINGKQVVMR